MKTMNAQSLLCRFYTLIPHDFGMKKPPLLDSEEVIKVDRLALPVGGAYCSLLPAGQDTDGGQPAGDRGGLLTAAGRAEGRRPHRRQLPQAQDRHRGIYSVYCCLLGGWGCCLLGVGLLPAGGVGLLLCGVCNSRVVCAGPASGWGGVPAAAGVRGQHSRDHSLLLLSGGAGGVSHCPARREQALQALLQDDQSHAALAWLTRHQLCRHPLTGEATPTDHAHFLQWTMPLPPPVGPAYSSTRGTGDGLHVW